jgi:chromosome segregation ATPase
MKFIGILVLGLLIGCGAAGAYAYTLLQDAQQKVTAAETSRDELGKTVKAQEEQLKTALAAKSSLEAELKEAKAQSGQLQTELQETKDQLAKAQTAREAAEEALAQAKKAPPQ